MSNNSYSSSIILDTRRPKKDNTFPLKIRVIINRESFHIPLGHSIEAQYWAEGKERISVSCKNVDNVTRLNNYLQKKKTSITDRLINLDETGLLGKLSLPEIKERLNQKTETLMLLEWTKEVIKELTLAKKFGTARVYNDCMKSIGKFLKDKDIPFLRIDYSWLRKYEAWYLSKNNEINGLSIRLRTLRALFNRAIKEKLIPDQNYPFKEYKIQKQKTRKRAIKQEELLRFMQFNPELKSHALAKEYFMISFWMMGASFIDLAYLKVSNIQYDRIEYKRKKTGQLHSIKITEPLAILLEPYLDSKSKHDFLLNIIKSQDEEHRYNDVQKELRRYNESLKEIARLCSIESNMTSYVSRHTFATLSKYFDIPTAVIKEQMGHTTEQQTEDYLASFENDVIDRHHALMTKKIESQFEKIEVAQTDSEMDDFQKIKVLISSSEIDIEKWKLVIAELSDPTANTIIGVSSSD